MESQPLNTQASSRNSRITQARVHPRYLILLFRWLVTTNWFLYLLAAILVITSFLVSYYTDAWHWFQRSGALMVSIGAILSTRHALGLMLESMNGEIGARSQTDDSTYLNSIEELRTCICGFILVAMGTFIWAYGDLLGCLVHWNGLCLG